METEKGKKAKVKCILIIIDGVGDVGMNALKRQTPLQERDYSFYNAIASTGLNGIMDPVETGLGCGSDTAHMSILGYNPFRHYRGRGCFETMGAGIPMDQEEIGFKCNFAHMEDSGIVTLRRVDRDFDQWGLSLVDVIHRIKIPGFDDYEVSCFHATEHRCGLKVRGMNLSEGINGTDPLKDNLKLKDPVPKMREKDNQKAIFTAKLIKALSDAIQKNLTEHPINKERQAQGKPTANILLLRGCGKRLGQLFFNLACIIYADVKPFKEMQNLNSFMIAPTAIINGLGQCIDMDNIKVQGTTGDYHTNLMIKAENIAKNIIKENYDFGFMHIKAVDDAGHDKSLEIKRNFLKKINESLIYLFDCLNGEEQKSNKKIEYIYCLTGDHSTPISYGDHSSEPVPVSMTTQTALKKKFAKLDENQLNSQLVKELCQIRDDVQLFNEIDCGAGVLGRFNGAQIMKLFLSFRQQVQLIYEKQ